MQDELLALKRTESKTLNVVWGMTKALGLVAILSTGVALIILSIDLPRGNDTASMLGGAILLSLGLIHVYSAFKDHGRIRRLTKQSRT